MIKVPLLICLGIGACTVFFAGSLSTEDGMGKEAFPRKAKPIVTHFETATTGCLYGQGVHHQALPAAPCPVCLTQIWNRTQFG